MTDGENQVTSIKNMVNNSDLNLKVLNLETVFGRIIFLEKRILDKHWHQFAATGYLKNSKPGQTIKPKTFRYNDDSSFCFAEDPLFYISKTENAILSD